MLGVLGDSAEHVRDLELRIARQEALYAADSHLLRSLRLDDVLQALAEVAANVLDAEKCSVVTWNESGDHITVRAAYGFSSRGSGRSLPPSEARHLSSRFLNGRPVFDYTPEQLPPGSLLRKVHEREGIRATLAAGICIRGEVFGAFGIASTRPREFTESERQLVLALAQKAGLAIENARLYEESQARLREVEALAAENARLREAAERRARASEALNHADERLYRSLRSDDVLDALLDVAAATLDADTSGLWAIDQARGALAVRAFRGTRPGFTQAIAELALLDAPLVKKVLDTDILVMGNLLDDERLSADLRALVEREGIHAALCAPITIDEQVYGIFSVGFRTTRTFSADEQRLVIALSQRAGLAIKNARLYEQAQHVATLEERQRLARELHDAVTQTLFSSALIADVLPELWAIDQDDGRRRLEQLGRLTRGALAEMRTLLVELRPGALAELPLPELLHQLADATSGRSMIQVNVSIAGRLRQSLPPDVHLAVYRMAQEALNNIVKHARARHARITLRFVRRGLVLTVEDDGIGFEPRRIPAGHLGFGIMRERAQGIGARLSIRSTRGKGSCLQVRWTT